MKVHVIRVQIECEHGKYGSLTKINRDIVAFKDKERAIDKSYAIAITCMDRDLELGRLLDERDYDLFFKTSNDYENIERKVKKLREQFSEDNSFAKYNYRTVYMEDDEDYHCLNIKMQSRDAEICVFVNSVNLDES